MLAVLAELYGKNRSGSAGVKKQGQTCINTLVGEIRKPVPLSHLFIAAALSFKRAAVLCAPRMSMN